MSTLTVKIAGNAVQIIENTLKVTQRVDDKDRCQFTVRDDPGTASYVKGQPVSVVDSVQGTLFTGFINKPTATNLFPNATQLWSVDCVNQFYSPAKKVAKPTTSTGKRHRGGKHVKQHAGTIAANQIQEYLAPDGIVGSFGLDWSELQTDWQSGILTGTAATTNTSTGNAGAGDLELAPSGNQVVATGTSSGFGLVNGLYLTGYASSGYNTAFTNRQIWSGTQALHTGDTFLYDVWVASTSPAIKAGCDFTCTDGTVFSASTTQDQQYLSPLTSTDLSGLANDQWYTRAFLIPASLNGKTLSSVTVGLNSASAGTYNAYFRRIEYQVSGGGTVIFFGDTSTLQSNVQVSNLGYTSVSLTAVQVENKTVVVAHAALSIGTATIVQSSQISWTSTLPGSATGIRETSLDNGATWQVATSGSAVPNLLPGMVVTSRSLQYRDTITAGTDPTANIGLSGPTLIVNSAPNSTKTDSITSYTTTADFNSGTLTNLITTGSNGITLNGVQKNWDNGNFSNQPLFGTASPFQQVENKQMVLQTGTGTDVRSQLQFAGQWQNFTAEVDVSLPAANMQCGLVYRCTNWGNSNDSYAYAASISTNQLLLAHGTNSTGAGSFTSIASFSLSLAVNSIHRLKIVINGNIHQIYVDGVLLISSTDSTYTAAGYLGLRVYNATGSVQSGIFDNFGVCAALSGTWQSPSINIAGPGTYGGSLVQWDTDGLPDSTTSITGQTSVDGGSTWQNVTNGGAVPGLTVGQSLTGKTLLLKLTLAANNAPVVPTLNGVTAWIMGQYSSSGARSTAPLAWDSMARANVVGGFGTATNGATYTQSGTGTVALTSNEALISNTTGDVHMQIGSVTSGDTEAMGRVSLSASTITAGVELRFATNTFYRVAVSSTAVSLVKDVSGTLTTLATTTQAQTLNTFYRVRFRIQGTNLSARLWLDGTTEPTSTWTVTTTDNAIASGGFALYANGTGTASFDSFRVAQYPDPSVALINAGRAANSVINWNGNTPPNTSVSVQTSLDNGVTWQAATSGSAISGIPAQTVNNDSFTSNTSANYTQTFGIGGGAATWTWDTANSRVVAVGGSKAALLWNGVSASDTDMWIDLYQSENAGMVWGWQNASNYYELVIKDSAASSGANTATINKIVAGSSGQLVTGSISFTTQTHHRFHMTMLAGVITVSMDENQILTTTDGSPFGAGSAGLRNDTGTSSIYLLQITPQNPSVASQFLCVKHTLSTTDPTVTPQITDHQALIADSTFGVGSSIDSADYRNTYVSDNIDELNTKSNYWWQIKGGKVTFQPRTAQNSVYILQSADILTGTLPTVEYSGDMYRNQQVLKGVYDTSIFTQSFVGDGTSKTWNVANPIQSVPTITLNGIVQSVGLQGVDTGKAFYWQNNNTAITQDNSGTTLRKGIDILSVAYLGAFGIDFSIDNTGQFSNTISQSQLAATDGTDGIVSAIEDVSAQNMNVAAATAYANQLLQRYGSIARTINFMTLHNGLKAGQSLPVFVPQLNIFDSVFLVVEVGISVRTTASGQIQYVYAVIASEAAALASWTKMFNKILRSVTGSKPAANA